MCACVRACAHARTCVCACVCVRVCARVSIIVCSLLLMLHSTCPEFPRTCIKIYSCLCHCDGSGPSTFLGKCILLNEVGTSQLVQSLEGGGSLDTSF